MLKKSSTDALFSLVQKPLTIWELVIDICKGNVTREGLNKDYRRPTSVCHFNAIANLPDNEVISLLMAVKEGEMTLQDMAKECMLRKKCRIIQGYMMDDLGAETWKELEEMHPMWATTNEVNQWIRLSKKQSAFTKSGNRPDGWEAWIRKIILADGPRKVAKPRNQSNFRHYSYRGSSYDVHCADVMTLVSLIGPDRKDFRNFFTYFI